MFNDSKISNTGYIYWLVGIELGCMSDTTRGMAVLMRLSGNAAFSSVNEKRIMKSNPRFDR